MSRRGPARLVIGGLVVLAGLAALWLTLSDDDPGPTPAPAAVSSAPPTGASRPALGASGRAPAVTVSPTLPSTGSAAGSAAAPTEYVVGDTRVRDHRGGNHAPMDVPPSIHPPDGRKIQSSTSFEVGQKVKAAVEACAASIPVEARGTKPRVEGQVVISIKDRQVTVRETTMQLRDVVGAAAPATKACIEEKTRAITHVADEADTESYDLTMSFAL